MMFCPKCGKELPNGSAFCAGCGANLGNKTVPVNANPQPKNTATNPGAVLSNLPNTKKFASNPIVLIAEIIAAIALISTFIPWYATNSSVVSLSGGVSGVASIFGASQGAFSFDPDYSIWGLPALAGTLSDYLSAAGALGGGSRASGASGLVTVCSWLCVLLWLASLALLIVGGIASRKKRDLKLINFGCGCLALCSIVFYFLVANIGPGFGAATAAPGVCLFFSLVASIVLVVSKRVSKKN